MIKDSFFARNSYLEILEKRVSDLKYGYRQNMAIIGDELVGKTSIVFRFLSKFCDTRIITLYLEVRPEPLPALAKRFIGVLLYNFLVNSNIPLEENLDFLIKKATRYIPRTVEKIRLILDALGRRKKKDIFPELLSLCEMIHQETSKYCVVILDEFHNLENAGIKDLYAEWCRLLISQKNTMYVIISSMKFKANAILSKNLSLLFGNFEVICVDPFDTKTSEEYLKHALQGLNFDAGLNNFIVHFTGGCPFYLEVISEALLKHGDINLTNILDELLFMPTGILNQRFTNYLKCFLDSPYSQDYIAILYLVSSGHNKFKDITHILHKPKKELFLRINHLLGLDAITRSGDFLKINDRVFGFWLKFVYQEKMQSLTFDAKNQKAAFRDKIEGMIQEFLISAEKPISERIMELLRLFGDEMIQVDRKRLRLNHFQEIKHFEFNNRGLREGLICRSNDSLWIMGFKNEVLTEEDITGFTKECKRYRHKLQRKIIIALQDVDINARLRALEEKIWTWDLNSLNQIFDLFSKPRIVI